MPEVTLQYARIPHWRFILITVVIAVLLSIIPLPENIKNAWPDWINLIVFYWVLTLPLHLGVMFGWMVGLLEDIISFSLLGQHALGKALTGALAALSNRRFRLFNFLEKMMVIFIVQSVNIAIVAWINFQSFDAPIHSALWGSALSTSLMWPLVSFLLDQIDPNVRRYGSARR